MYAIVEIAGQQFKVEEKQNIFVHRLDGEEGAKVEFGNVLLVDNNGKVSVGVPYVDGAAVKAKITAHVKGDKVIVFKKKRRKGYQKKNGHRQLFSKIEIEKIQLKGGTSKSAKKEETAGKGKAPVKPEKSAKTSAVKQAAIKKPAKPKATKEATKPKATKEATKPKPKAKAGEKKTAKKAPKAASKKEDGKGKKE